MKEFQMAGKKFAWRREDILAASKAASKSKQAEKPAIAPSSGGPADWADLRNVADGEKQSILRPAPAPKA